MTGEPLAVRNFATRLDTVWLLVLNVQITVT